MLARSTAPSYTSAIMPLIFMAGCLGYVTYFMQVKEHIGFLLEPDGELDRTIVGLLVMAGIFGFAGLASALRTYSYNATNAANQRIRPGVSEDQHASDGSNPEADAIVKRYLASRATDRISASPADRRQAGSSLPAGQADRRQGHRRLSDQPAAFGRRR